MTDTAPIPPCWLDPMTRLFPDQVPEPDPEAAHMTASAGGCAAVLLGIPDAPAGSLEVVFEGWQAAPSNWPEPTCFRLLDVAVDGNMGDPGHPQEKVDPKHLPYLVREAPFRVHEILEPGQKMESDGTRTEGFLLLVELPEDAVAGRATFTVTVRGAGQEQRLEGSLTVRNAHWPRPQRLGMTNWTALNRLLYPYPNVEPDSDQHWALIEQLLRWLRRGGQNTLLLGYFVDVHRPRFPLVQPNWHDDGTVSFDFRRFDRLVQMALSLGFERLEGGHLGHKRKLAKFRSDLACQHLHTTLPRPDGTYDQVPFHDPDARQFLTAFLGALREHLESRGWHERYLQHVADEPFYAVAESYLQAIEWVRLQWPGVRIIDAASTHGAAYSLDIPIPESDYLDPHLPLYQRLAAQDKEIWFYTCCYPGAPWLNRFLDFPLNHGGLLPLVTFRYGLHGFLHWGANQWSGDLSRDHCPSNGDGWILFPGPDGPLPTLRWLALRLGIEDHELLTSLADAGQRDKAHALVQRLVRSNTDYDCEPATVRAVRAELRQAVASL